MAPIIPTAPHSHPPSPSVRSQPAPGDPGSLAAVQELTQLSGELTRLQLEEMRFHLVSAEAGVSVTRWRVRACSRDADAEICLQYDATKDEGGELRIMGQWQGGRERWRTVSKYGVFVMGVCMPCQHRS